MKQRLAAIGTVETLPHRVAAFLSREIESGELNPGARLPTEQELSEKFGVSRNVVREAIAQLRADGVIEARQGIGAFVLAPEQRAAIRIDREALKDTHNMERLFELRCILEAESAALAAARRNREHLDSIKAALDRMGGEERWEEGSIDADLLFHREIARATGNNYIHTFISFVCEQIRHSIHYARMTNPLHDLVEINVGEHVRIYDALVAGDPAASEAAMRAHIVGAANRVGVKLPLPKANGAK
ncbi:MULTISPECIES: FadR/GntR family transcriptional regulator [unclassified Mesorhizobium]|uniref:FadR/GntR family transcriptional regulator n=1 Tax=unclassified Mesorhizobium TaxID=325217 RepID=UPI000FE3E287|nr:MULTISPECIES: FadR/GntR family transcriptional regulator [unclassified Mesorhizobium]MDG4894833.1 FadR/GntR family transcriptional regulator [Mesorhizobium sp. WSM4976]RWH75583.1 MAG: FadR family transcriptional regulator [Mesorhizobium sp.]RWL31989.1 MAG: FadR family transcriptional regulator [Mesorhizobium sp.]RWL33359.1 MAG: FadR family transcriptional regulator [Mesorhizobium sp.]RWL39602.1 MAG: FadR family transcriptional regulator [Mesorhizobium sp.]